MKTFNLYMILHEINHFTEALKFKSFQKILRSHTMRKHARWITALLFLFVGVSFAGNEDQPKFVGVKLCSPCHKGDAKGKMFELWQASKHAQAFKALQSDEAKKIAEQKGLKTAPHEAPECLKCHVTGAGEDPARFGASFNKEDGVGCESCHGAGDAYKGMAVMKDKAKAAAAGLKMGTNDPKLCEGCHNSESPTFKEFKYEEMWKQIAHPRPKK